MKISNGMKKIIIVCAVVGLAVLSGVYFVRFSPKTTQEQNNSNQAVGLSLDQETVNFGQMTVSDEKTAKFVLKNTGQAPLTLKEFETSCDCTFGKVKTLSGESPEINMRMHSPASFAWRTTLNPGEEAEIYVTYKPAIMPAYGLVTRSLLFKTSDPQKPKVELKVIAVVK